MLQICLLTHLYLQYFLTYRQTVVNYQLWTDTKEFSTKQVNVAQIATATVVQISQSKCLENTLSLSCRLDFFLIISQSLIIYVQC